MKKKMTETKKGNKEQPIFSTAVSPSLFTNKAKILSL
jgi:hypothetical protein